jgi:WD40 repeat protein
VIAKNPGWLCAVGVGCLASLFLLTPPQGGRAQPRVGDKPLGVRILMAKEHERNAAFRNAEDELELGKGNAAAFESLKKSQATERQALIGKKVAGALNVREVKTIEAKGLAGRQVVVVLAFSVKGMHDDPDALLIHAYPADRKDPSLDDLKSHQRVLVNGTVAELPAFYGRTSHVKLIGCTFIPADAHTDTVRSVAFRSDGKSVVSAGDDNMAKLWDVTSRRNTATLDIGGVCTVQFSPDGKTLAAGSRGDFGVRGLHPEDIKLFDVATGKETLTLAAGGVASLVFSPDGKTLACVSSCTKGFARAPVVSFWKVATGEKTAAWTLAEDNSCMICSIALSSDGKTLASAGGFSNVGGQQSDLRLWDVATGRNFATLKGHTAYVLCAAFSPDGKTLASGSNDTKVKLWDVTSGKNIATLTGHTEPVYSVTFSPDGKTLASGGDRTIRLWDVATGKNATTFEDQWLQSLAFSPDGKTLAAGGGSGPPDTPTDVKLWDVASGKHRSLGTTQPGGDK